MPGTRVTFLSRATTVTVCFGLVLFVVAYSASSAGESGTGGLPPLVDVPLVFADGFEGDALPGCGSNEDCTIEEFCATGSPGLCEVRGICESRPQECAPFSFPVCGCNGVTYANACEALAAGVNVDYEGSCRL